MYEKICPECGKKFLAERIQKRYCGEECRIAGNRKNVNAACRRHRDAKRKGKATGTAVAEINRLARESGMSYGQYVSQNHI